MVNKRRFSTITGRKLMDLKQDPLNISLAEEGKLRNRFICIELYVSVSWISAIDGTDLIKEKYGFPKLLQTQNYFDEHTGRNHIKQK